MNMNDNRNASRRSGNVAANTVSPRVADIVANALRPVCNGKFKVGDKVKMRLTGTVYTVKRIDGNRLYIGDGNSYVTDYDVTPFYN